MKSPILKSMLGLTLLATICLTGCAHDPVVTSQTTTTKRITPAPMMVEPAVQQSTTTTTQY